MHSFDLFVYYIGRIRPVPTEHLQPVSSFDGTELILGREGHGVGFVDRVSCSSRRKLVRTFQSVRRESLFSFP